MKDKDRIKWLEDHQGCALISDDDGRWAVSTSGFQPAVCGGPISMESTFFVSKEEWKNSIREAIDAAIEEESGEG